MKKPVKIALWALAGLVVLIVAAVLAIPLWLGPTAAAVARKVVPMYTGCDFKIERISLNPYSGKFDIVEAHLANPNGYDAPEAFSVATVHVDVAVCSLLTDTIHVRDIEIDAPYVSYVFDDAGSNNFERIAAYAQSKLGASEKKEEAKPEEKKPEAEKKEGAGKKVIIDRLAINGVKVKYRMLTLPIPVPTLTDIGKDSGGATFSEVVGTVWGKIQGSFTSIGSGLGSAASALGEGATNALKGATGLLNSGKDGVADGAKAVTDSVKNLGGGAADAAKSVTDSVKNVGGDAAKSVSEGAKAVTEGAAGALKKVGNLFGK